jgi:transcriptional regulator with XRE-family HTH domain
MQGSWSESIRSFRLRHGFSQQQLAALIGVAQRTVSRWERGDDRPSIPQQLRLRDLGWAPSSTLLRAIAATIANCPVPRALTSSANLTLRAVSAPAIAKRPSVVELVGTNLAPLAFGPLRDILEDRPLQRGIARREIAGVVAITQSVLRTRDAETPQTWCTTITYFHDDGIVFSDAVSALRHAPEPVGYTPIPMDQPLV